jgi:hypothetical protein
MNSSKLIDRKPEIGPKAFRRGSKTKKWQIEAKPAWSQGTCFGGKINWFRPKNSAKKRAPDLENQESG